MSTQSPNGSKRKISVIGDVSVDCAMYHDEAGRPATPGERCPPFDVSPGGALFLAEFLKSVVREASASQLPDETEVEILGKSLKVGEISRKWQSLQKTYIGWRCYQADSGSTKQGGGQETWRMDRQSPYDEPDDGIKPSGGSEEKKNYDPFEWNTGRSGLGEHDVVAVVDNKRGFRKCTDKEETWNGLLESGGTGKSNPWIVLKARRGITESALWKHLMNRNCLDRLVVVITANDIRKTEVYISQSLSWERTVEDLMREFSRDDELKELGNAAYVVVSLRSSAAILVPRQSCKGAGTQAEWELFYDRMKTEEGWEQASKGTVLGYTTCLTGGVCYSMASKRQDADMHDAIRSGIAAGLSAMRKLYETGREPEQARPPVGGGIAPEDRQLKLPLDPGVAQSLVGSLRQPSDPSTGDFIRVQVPADVHRRRRQWTILEDKCEQHQKTLTNQRRQGQTGPMNAHWELAKKIACHGIERVEGLRGVPIAKFGKLRTVDRREIEGYDSIRSLIKEYCEETDLKRPLSIVVFGPAGAGKSFGVKQVAQEVSGRKEEIGNITVNLSQFNRPSELIPILHEVVDKAKGDSIPLVFWDEFDTSFKRIKLGWLRHFLGLMEDGKYEEHHRSHHIGRCIFVFAGSTYDTTDKFCKDYEDSSAAKARDFISRLSGFLDVAGANPRNREDRMYVIRRAIVLRSILLNEHKQLFIPAGDAEEDIGELQIDPGVLRALLTVPAYRHNGRSLRAVISMSRLADKTKFEQSALPGEAQLNLHVDGRMFHDLVTMDPEQGRGRAWPWHPRCDWCTGPCFVLRPCWSMQAAVVN